MPNEFAPRSPSFLEVWEDTQYWYFSAANVNGLFRAHRETMETAFLSCFPEESVGTRLLHRHVFAYQQRLYFTPFFGHGIAIYTPETGAFDFVRLADENESGLLFAESYRDAHDERLLWIIPADRRTELVVFDMEMHTFRSEISFWRSIEQAVPAGTLLSIDSFGTSCTDNVLRLVLCGSNAVVSVDLDDFAVRCDHLPAQFSAEELFCFDGEEWFLLRNSDSVLCHDTKTGKLTEYTCPTCAPSSRPYTRIIAVGDARYVLPFLTNRILRIDPARGELTPVAITYPPQFERLCWQDTFFFGFTPLGGQAIRLFPYGGNGMLELDFQTESAAFIPLLTGEDNTSLFARAAEEQLKNSLRGDNMLQENDLVGLDELLDFVEQIQVDPREQTAGHAGDAIWEALRKELP
ncbi:MAG: hypothetical protein QM689_09180 [Oscillospiraceae bacterium]